MKAIIVKLRTLFVLFIIFSVCGWIYEVVLTIVTQGYFQHRGFLFGPWLPIYGFGGIGIYLLFGKLAKKTAGRAVKVLLGAVIFVLVCLFATALELIASYIIDAVGIGYDTLWDYYSDPVNFDGRISLVSSLRFGVIGIAALYAALPIAERLSDPENARFVSIAAAAFAVLFFGDVILRFVILYTILSAPASFM